MAYSKAQREEIALNNGEFQRQIGWPMLVSAWRGVVVE